MAKRASAWGAVMLFAVVAGCGTGSGGGGGNGSGKKTGEASCESGADCAGNVCVALIDGNNPPNYCTQTCGSCPSGFFCDSDTFKLVGLSFCRFGAQPMGAAPAPSEPPRLPCKSDADCENGAVCATYMGARDCTIKCAADADCQFSAGGVTVKFAKCGADTTPGQSRNVCLPDPACYSNPLSCIQ